MGAKVRDAIINIHVSIGNKPRLKKERYYI